MSRLASALAVLGLMLGSRATLAHSFEHPKVLRLGVRQDQLLLSVMLDVNPGSESLQTRNIFDRDQDGALDSDEQAKLRRYLEGTAMLWLKLKLDGQVVEPKKLEESASQLDRPTSSSETLGISLLYSVPLPAGPGIQIQIEDRDKDARRHVPLVIDLGPGWFVALASQGELHPASRQINRIGLGPGAPLTLSLTRSSP